MTTTTTQQLWHHSPKTGRSERCTGNCDYGDNTTHGTSPEEVAHLEERKLADEYGGSFGASVKKKDKKKGRDYPEIKIEGNINDDYPYPQANDIEKIDTVIEAVNNGANSTTGVGESLMDDKRSSSKEGARKRDGHYYAEAAGYLGFVEKSGGSGSYEASEYNLTDLGRSYLDAEEGERAEILKSSVENMPAMQAYRGAGGGQDGREAAIETMDDRAGETTAERRVSTIETWATKIDSNDFNDIVAGERKNSSEHIQKAITNDEHRRKEREEKKKEQQRKEDQKFGSQKDNEKQCMECFMIKNASQFAPGSSVCNDCDE